MTAAIPKFTLLMYHRVAESRSADELRYTCSPTLFESHMAYLQRKGLLLGLADVEAHLSGERPLLRGGVAITFDDGYADNYFNAFPILQKYAIPATIFVVSGAVGGVNHWDVAKGLPSLPMMDWPQLRELAAAGVSIGSHTRTHPKLVGLSLELMREELQGAKRDLEQGLVGDVRYFAYPYGRVDPQAVAAVQEAGYCLAVGTQDGFNDITTPVLQLRRIEVFGDDTVEQLELKIAAGHRRPGRWLSGVLRAKRAIYATMGRAFS